MHSFVWSPDPPATHVRLETYSAPQSCKIHCGLFVQKELWQAAANLRYHKVKSLQWIYCQQGHGNMLSRGWRHHQSCSELAGN